MKRVLAYYVSDMSVLKDKHCSKNLKSDAIYNIK